MNFIKTSILWNYLYSPISWLHKYNNTLKIFTIIVYLIILPYISLKKIFFCSVFFQFVYYSIYVPIGITVYLIKVFIIFILYTLFNIQNYQQVIESYNLQRSHILIFNSFNSLSKIKNCPLNREILSQYNYYLSSSLIRLLSISFLYLICMKILLLTTSYNKILEFFLKYINHYKELFIQKFILEVQMSIQFLEIILKQIQLIKFSHMTRSIKNNNNLSIYKLVLLYFFCLQQLIINSYNSIYNISNTIYSNEVYLKNLNHSSSKE